jgi:hypothetical protein
MDLHRFIYTNKKVYMNKCLCCGKEVKNKFCNTSCQNRYQKRKPTIEQIKKGQTTRFGEFKPFMVVCNKCEKEFEVIEREKLHPQKEKYYCSRSCANSRQHTEESKLKTSNSIKKLIENGNAPGVLAKYKDIKLSENRIIHNKICENCQKEFQTKRINQKYCSVVCGARINIKLASIKQLELRKEDPEYWSKIQKKAYSNGHNYVAGGTCRWYDYKDIRVQGTYELRTCSILDRWKESGKIKDWKYTNDRFDYVGVDGKNHTYLLDFKIFENDNSFYYLETKGWEKDNDKLKWESVKEKGFKLEIWFEEDIIKNELG